jgi:hypothetical protein
MLAMRRVSLPRTPQRGLVVLAVAKDQVISTSEFVKELSVKLDQDQKSTKAILTEALNMIGDYVASGKKVTFTGCAVPVS